MKSGHCHSSTVENARCPVRSLLLDHHNPQPRKPNLVTEFIGGISEGIYDVRNGTVAVVKATLLKKMNVTNIHVKVVKP
jgi:hypothetical protein